PGAAGAAAAGRPPPGAAGGPPGPDRRGSQAGRRPGGPLDRRARRRARAGADPRGAAPPAPGGGRGRPGAVGAGAGAGAVGPPPPSSPFLLPPSSVSTADLLTLDDAVQAAVKEYADGQASVWTVAGSDYGVKVLREVLLQQAEKLLRQRLPARDVAELFLGEA